MYPNSYALTTYPDIVLQAVGRPLCIPPELIILVSSVVASIPALALAISLQRVYLGSDLVAEC